MPNELLDEVRGLREDIGILRASTHRTRKLTHGLIIGFVFDIIVTGLIAFGVLTLHSQQTVLNTTHQATVAACHAEDQLRAVDRALWLGTPDGAFPGIFKLAIQPQQHADVAVINTLHAFVVSGFANLKC